MRKVEHISESVIGRICLCYHFRGDLATERGVHVTPIIWCIVRYVWDNFICIGKDYIQTRRLRRSNMAEKIVKVGLKKESGYLYFIDKDGDVSRAKMQHGAVKGKK